MTTANALLTLLKPHLTEKTVGFSSNQSFYAFKILKTATKTDVKNAVENIFDVEVAQVRIINIKSKSTRFGKTLGRHKAWKKAYVTLKSGHNIDIQNA